jgi:DNA repair protein RadC
MDCFESHEVLELLLYYSIPYQDTNPLAHDLIKRYGSLAAVMEAGIDDLQTNEGIGRNTAILLSSIPSFSRRYMVDRWGEKSVLNSSSKAGRYAVALFTGRIYEAFYVISLDAQNRVNNASVVHEGTINEAHVYPRLIIESALRHHANSVILAHNHPGGTTSASSADIEVTRKISEAMRSISIQVVDHIIVAGENYVSFAETGLL